jgi:hypothetical protein
MLLVRACTLKVDAWVFLTHYNTHKTQKEQGVSLASENYNYETFESILLWLLLTTAIFVCCMIMLVNLKNYASLLKE